MEELWLRRLLIFQNTVQSMAQIIYGLRLLDLHLSIEGEVS